MIFRMQLTFRSLNVARLLPNFSEIYITSHQRSIGAQWGSLKIKDKWMIISRQYNSDKQAFISMQMSHSQSSATYSFRKWALYYNPIGKHEINLGHFFFIFHPYEQMLKDSQHLVLSELPSYLDPSKDLYCQTCLGYSNYNSMQDILSHFQQSS